MPARPPRLRRTPTLALKAVGISLLVYLVGINAFLNSGLLPRIINGAANVHGEALHLDFGSAWMVWPGRLRLRDLKLRAQAKDNQWYLAIDGASVRVQMSALLAKTFRATQVDADGVTFRIRPRLPQTAAKSAADRYPPIPGFASYPSMDDTQDWIPTDEEMKQLFQVELERVQVHHVRELWVADYHWAGTGEAAGDVFLRPPQWVELAPTTLRLQSGTLSVGSEVVVPDFQGTVEATIDRFRPLQKQPMDVLPFITANVRLGGTVRSLGFLRVLPVAMELDSEAGAPRFATDFRIVRGKMTSSTPLTVELPKLKVAIRDYQLVGSVQVKSGVTEDNDNGLAHLEVNVTSLSIAQTGKAQPLLRVPGIRLQANLDDLDLSHGVKPVWVGMEMKQADFIDLSFANALVPEAVGLKVLSGRGRLGGTVAWGLRSGLGQGELEWISEGTQATVGDTAISGDFALRARLADLSLPGGKKKGFPESQFDLVAKNLKIASGATQVNTRAHVTGALDLDSQGTHAEVAVSLQSVTLRTKGQSTSIARIPEVKVTAQIPSASNAPTELGLRVLIPDLRLLNAYLPDSSRLEVLDGKGTIEAMAHLSGGGGEGKVTVAFKDLKAHAAEFRVDANVQGEAEIAIADGKLEFKPLQFRLTEGAFQIGAESVVRKLHGQGTWDAQGFLSRLRNQGLLAATTAKVRLSGEVESVRFLNRYLRGPVAPVLDGGGGPFLIDVGLARGKIAPGSQLSLEGKAIRSTWAEYNLEGSLRFLAQIGVTDGAPSGALSLLLSPLALRRTGETKPIAVGQQLRIDAPFQSLELTQNFLDLPAVIDLPSAKITDMSFINLFLPRNTFLRFTGGSGQLAGRLVLGTGNTRGHGTIQLITDSVEAYYSEMKLKGNVQARFQISDMSLSRGEFELARSFLSLQGVRVEGTQENADHWKGDLEVTRAELTLGSHRLEGQVHGRFKNARPIIAVFDATTDLPPLVLPFLQLDGLSFDASLLMVQSFTDVTLHQMNGGPFDVRGWLQVREGLKTGALLINSGRLSVGVGVHDDVPVVQLKDAPLWFRKHNHPSTLTLLQAGEKATREPGQQNERSIP